MTHTPQTRGVLYVATGPRHTQEALQSAQSLHKHMPDLAVILYTDQDKVASPLFTEIRKIERPLHTCGDKILPLKETPFERTLFLDTDTHICAPIQDVFEILDRFDLAASHAPYRPSRPFVTPDCFCELNSGVFAYRKTPDMLLLFEKWLELYQVFVEETGRDEDQPTFRQAIYESAIKLYVLPPEYNLRTVMPGFSGRGNIKIVHGRGIPMDQLTSWVNDSQNIRVFLSSPLQLTRDHLQILSPSGRLITALLTAFIQPLARIENTLRCWKRQIF